MRRNIIGATRHKTSVLVLVVCIAGLMLTLGIPASASAHATTTSAGASGGSHTIIVKPNGVDDTTDIQAAFNTCTSHGWTCTIELVKGTYYTEQITAYGFKGSFVGAGPGRTVIQALSNLPPPNPTYNTPATPFWAAAPGASNPWPVLFTFVNGNFLVSGIGFTEPYMYPVSAGWYGNLDTAVPGATSQSLFAVVLVTGETAYSTFVGVTVTGAAGDLTIPVGTPSSFNLENGIAYEGMFLPSGWTNFFGDQIPLSGTFSMTFSNLSYAFSAIYFQNLLDAAATVCFNSIYSSPVPEFVDVSNSQLTFCGNSITNVAAYAGLGGLQSYFKSDLLPSTVYVSYNYFGTNWEGSGPSLFDYGPLLWGVSSTLNAVVTGNTIVSDNSCGCYTAAVTDVIIGGSLASWVVSGNTVLGGGGGVNGGVIAGVDIGVGPSVIAGNTISGAYIGVYLTGAIDTEVNGNLIKNSVQYGIALTDESSDNLIEWNGVSHSGVYDLYWDGTGTGNVWFGNMCKTSSPPGLC